MSLAGDEKREREEADEASLINPLPYLWRGALRGRWSNAAVRLTRLFAGVLIRLQQTLRHPTDAIDRHWTPTDSSFELFELLSWRVYCRRPGVKWSVLHVAASILRCQSEQNETVRFNRFKRHVRDASNKSATLCPLPDATLTLSQNLQQQQNWKKKQNKRNTKHWNNTNRQKFALDPSISRKN